MGMTEKQGGSDVRTNTTRAVPAADGTYRLTGHKWFTSAPMCDVFLVLAQAPGGLTCFVVPRVLPDGEPQHVPDPAAQGQARQPVQRLQRAGVRRHRRLAARRRGPRRARPSSRWSATTRLDCVIGSTSLMRAAVAQATHHAATGGVRPLPRRPAADASRARRPRDRVRGRDALMLRLAAAVDDDESRLQRLATGGRQVLGLQARAGGRGRSAGVPGRQRVRRGLPDGPALPRGAAELDLGGLRATSTRSTCCGRWPAEPGAWEAFRDEVGLALGADPRLDAAFAALDDRAGRHLVDRGPRPPAGRAAWRWCCRARCSSAVRPAVRRRRVLRLPARRRLGSRVRHAAAPASTARAIVERATPKVA